MPAKFSKGDKVRVFGVHKGCVVDVVSTPGSIYAVATGKPVYRYRVRWNHASESGVHAWLDADAVEPWDAAWQTPRTLMEIKSLLTDPKWNDPT
jgi:hypothetical protein